MVNNLTGTSIALDSTPWSGCQKILGNYADDSAVLRPYEAAVYRPRQ